MYARLERTCPELSFRSVRYEAALLWLRRQAVYMHRKKQRKVSSESVRASVKRELGLPRMTHSARIAMRDLDAAHIPAGASTSMPGTVRRIIPSSRRNRSEKADIEITGGSRNFRDFLIDNLL